MEPIYQAPVFKKKKTAVKSDKPVKKSIWQNPHFLTGASIAVVFLMAAIIHFSFGKKLDPTASSTSKKGFAMNSRFFSDGKAKDLSEIQKKKLEEIGLKTEDIAKNNEESVLKKQIKAKNFQEQRRIMAMSKYEAIRERAESRERLKAENRKKYETGTAAQLKEAVTSLKDNDLLGLLKLENMLEERYKRSGADSQDLDSLVFAYTQLAKTYEKKQMQDKAKEAYIHAFELMKIQAPAEQEPKWNESINKIQQIPAKASR